MSGSPRSSGKCPFAEPDGVIYGSSGAAGRSAAGIPISFVFADFTALPCFEYPSRCRIAIHGGYTLQIRHTLSQKASSCPLLQDGQGLNYTFEFSRVYFCISERHRAGDPNFLLFSLPFPAIRAPVRAPLRPPQTHRVYSTHIVCAFLGRVRVCFADGPIM